MCSRLRDLVEAVLQAARHRARCGTRATRDRMSLQAHHPRPAVEADDVEVDAVAALEIRGREQVVHQLDQVDAVGARHDDERASGSRGRTRRGRPPPSAASSRASARRSAPAPWSPDTWYGKRGDDDVAVLDLPGGARLEAADALLVELHEVGARRDDLRAGGQIRALHVLHQRARWWPPAPPADGCRRAATSRRLCGGMSVAMPTAMPEVPFSSRFGRRAGRITGSSSVPSKFGAQSTVPCAELAEQHVGVLGELRLGVAHGREGLRIVLRAPVALPVDDRIAIGERLRHEHHGLVAGAVAVRMELADAHRRRCARTSCAC